MTALHHIVGLILFHGNVSKLVCGILLVSLIPQALRFPVRKAWVRG